MVTAKATNRCLIQQGTSKGSHISNTGVLDDYRSARCQLQDLERKKWELEEERSLHGDVKKAITVNINIKAGETREMIVSFTILVSSRNS